MNVISREHHALGWFVFGFLCLAKVLDFPAIQRRLDDLLEGSGWMPLTSNI
jgi:hypothetical protein